MFNFLKKEIPTLMYHRLVDSEEGKGIHTIYFDVDEFEKHLIYLKEKNYKTITFKDLKKIGLKDRLNEKNIILTFDDGYKDNYELLFPLLKKYNMKAVIYMVSHLEYNKWNTDNDGEKKFDLMSKKEILEMHNSGLVEFGGHTMHHVDLRKYDKKGQIEEINGNKIWLENLLGEKLVSFAYPFGFFNDSAKKVVKELGFDFGVATDSGPFKIEDDLFEIRRIGIYPDLNFRRFKRRVTGRYTLKKTK